MLWYIAVTLNYRISAKLANLILHYLFQGYIYNMIKISTVAMNNTR